MMSELYALFPQKQVCQLNTCSLPDKLEPDRVQLRAEVSLLSFGSEMAIYSGRHSAFSSVERNEWAEYPHRPGYNMVGRIERLGEEVKGFSIGDRVFAPVKHESAPVCMARNLQPIPDGIDAKDAVFVHMAAVSINGIRKANIQLGETVVIFGQGLVGLFATLFAKMSGAISVIALDKHEERRKAALNMGADAVFDPRQPELSETLQKLTGGRLADAVIEASGNPEAIVQAAELTQPGGRIMLLGSPHGRVEFDFYSQIHSRSIRLIGTHINSTIHEETLDDCWNVRRNRDYFLQLLSSGKIKVDSLISKCCSPEELPSIYEAAMQPNHTEVGVIIDWTRNGKEA